MTEEEKKLQLKKIDQLGRIISLLWILILFVVSLLFAQASILAYLTKFAGR